MIIDPFIAEAMKGLGTSIALVEESIEFKKNYRKIVMEKQCLISLSILLLGWSKMYRKNTLRKALELTLKKHPENIQKTKTTQQQIIDAIKANPTITRRELIYLLNSTEGSIKHHLSQLTKKGIIKREGSDRTGRWVVTKYPQ